MQYPQLLPDTTQSINALKAATAIVSTIYEEFGLTPGRPVLGSVQEPARPVKVSLSSPLISGSKFYQGTFVRADEHHLYVSLWPDEADWTTVTGEKLLWDRTLYALFCDLDRCKHLRRVIDSHGPERGTLLEIYMDYRHQMGKLLTQLSELDRRAEILEIVKKMATLYMGMLEQERAFGA